jgi:peptidoglycan/LPS O-acetylase OafA/YrhL
VAGSCSSRCCAAAAACAPVVAVAVLANAYTAVLWHLGADPDRLYYMADTRFAQLLTGCALAAAAWRGPTSDR